MKDQVGRVTVDIKNGICEVSFMGDIDAFSLQAAQLAVKEKFYSTYMIMVRDRELAGVEEFKKKAAIKAAQAEKDAARQERLKVSQKKEEIISEVVIAPRVIMPEDTDSKSTVVITNKEEGKDEVGS